MDTADDLLRPTVGSDEPDTQDGENPHGPASSTATTSPLGLSISWPLPGVCVVEVSGELDMLSAPLLGQQVRERLSGGLAQLVIDLEAVTFLGSTGLTTLLECSRWLAAASPGSTLQLTGTTQRVVYRPLELTGLLPMFDIYPTLSEALAQIPEPQSDPPCHIHASG